MTKQLFDFKGFPLPVEQKRHFFPLVLRSHALTLKKSHKNPNVADKDLCFEFVMHFPKGLPLVNKLI